MAKISTTDTGMVSTTGHTATLAEGAGEYDKGAWIVSWCPERRFDRNQAITALTLAEIVCSGRVDASHRKWPFARDFAEELGMNVYEATALIRGETP